MADREHLIERLGFVRELLRVGGFASEIKARHVKTIDDAIDFLKEQEIKKSISDAVYNTARQFRQTIVKCKDCKYHREGPLGGCEKHTIFAPDDWFCADGKMKDCKMDEELQDNINFLRSAYLLTKETGEPFKMDSEIIKMLLDFLKKIKLNGV